MCVEMPADVAKPTRSIVVSLRPMERHDGGSAIVALERFQVVVSLDTGHCSPCDNAAERLLAEHRWIPAALAPQLEQLRRRVRRLLAQRDRLSYRSILDCVPFDETLAYDRLFPYDWDLIFAHDGHLFWASDQHCPNPACHCRELSVVLYNLDTPDAPTVGTLRIGFGPSGPRAKPSSQAVDGLFEPLWTKYESELTRRHNEFRGAVADHAASGHRASQPPNPRRNALCPCGSGKKFKRCCALRVPAAAWHSGARR
jgi:hypothetical protein